MTQRYLQEGRNGANFVSISASGDTSSSLGEVKIISWCLVHGQIHSRNFFPFSSHPSACVLEREGGGNEILIAIGVAKLFSSLS